MPETGRMTIGFEGKVAIVTESTFGKNKRHVTTAVESRLMVGGLAK